MNSRENWCSEKMEKLLVEETRMSTLAEIKDYLLINSQDEVNRITNIFQLPLIFDCLNDTKKEQIDLAVDVLTLCMKNMTLGESTSRYEPFLERALYHPESNVKLMALNEIYRSASNSSSMFQLTQQIPIIIATVVCTGDEDLSVAKIAGDVIVQIGKSREGMRQLLLPEIKKNFADVILISDVVRFRIYDIIINISCQCEENLQSILTTGLISSLLSELDSPDILLRLNVIEILSTLASTSHGFEYLQSKNIIKRLNAQLATINEDPLGSLIAPGLLKFFGNLTHQKPNQMYDQYPLIFTILFDIIKSNDVSLLGIALDSLGHIAQTNNGKEILTNFDRQMFSTLRFIGDNIAIFPTDIRIRSLQCVENLIRIRSNEQNNRISSLVSEWFRMLSADPMSVVVKYSEIPFIEVRVAALGVLQAMAEQQWGQEMINVHPGLIEFLMDRRIENAKKSKEIKYEIIKALSTSNVFTTDIHNKLQEFVKQGPFYVQAVTEVLIEGSS